MSVLYPSHFQINKWPYPAYWSRPKKVTLNTSIFLTSTMSYVNRPCLQLLIQTAAASLMAPAVAGRSTASTPDSLQSTLHTVASIIFWKYSHVC